MNFQQLRKVLIANRGEIAVRVARACSEQGITSVAIYAAADGDALHVLSADEAYILDGVTPRETYLDANQILDIARRSGCDAVHPGYGFLSESGDFAEAVEAAGLTWIGPSPSVIRLLGDKLSAREVALEIGAPLAPGSDGPVSSAREVREFAEAHGLPVIVKAAFGGGGRGMKVVHELDDVDAAYESAVREARLAFGREECFVEKFLEKPRHIEAQVLADQHGNVRVIGTRDCSLQRRHQKLVEEAPAPFLTDEQRRRVSESAAEMLRKVGYVGAGTVEYLLDRSGTLSFLEVNTRLQVEHTVTEETTGIDLVKEQLAIAAGAKLDVKVPNFPARHAIEFRINAEDPGRGFLPSPGVISRVEWPTGPGIRIDAGVRDGSMVPDQYDSLIAKIIVSGNTREEALRRARRAVSECRIEGVATVLPFHELVLEHDEFVAEDQFGVYTTWIETELSERIAENAEFSVWPTGDRRRVFGIEVDGRRVELGLPESLLGSFGRANGDIERDAGKPEKLEEQEQQSNDAVIAPAPGIVVKWLVDLDAEVRKDDPILVLEAMKTETKVLAPCDGRLSERLVKMGSQVAAGAYLAKIA